MIIKIADKSLKITLGTGAKRREISAGVYEVDGEIGKKLVESGFAREVPADELAKDGEKNP